jgi:hypothetical protein
MPSDAVRSTFHTVAVAMARPEVVALAKEIGVTDVIKERGEEAVEHCTNRWTATAFIGRSAPWPSHGSPG